MRFSSLLCLLASALSAQTAAVLAGLSTGTYFPLDVGDRWVYRIDSRIGTASYQTWRVDRTTTLNGHTYSVIAIEGPGDFYYESWFRADSSGRVYYPSGASEGLFLDPNVIQGQGAILLTTGHTSATTAFGTFPDAITYVNNMGGGLIQETGILARGLGLTTSTANLLTGSSGGPTDIRTLVEASVAGGIHFPAPVPAVSLGLDNLSPDVTGKHVTNCIIPCYFAACYLGDADPPGTYKPCLQARVELANWPAAASRSVRLQFIAPDGAIDFDQTLGLDVAPDASVTFIQVPLYTQPNQPFLPGNYQLLVKTSDGTAQAALAVRIQ